MDLFNKTFFRFAFGFLGIIFFSVIMILAANAFTHEAGDSKTCLVNCAHQ